MVWLGGWETEAVMIGVCPDSLHTKFLTELKVASEDFPLLTMRYRETFMMGLTDVNG